MGRMGGKGKIFLNLKSTQRKMGQIGVLESSISCAAPGLASPNFDLYLFLIRFLG